MLRMVPVWTSSSFGLCEPTQLSSLLYSLFFLFLPAPRLSSPLVCLCKHVSKSQALKRYDCDVLCTFTPFLQNKVFIVKQSMPLNPT